MGKTILAQALCEDEAVRKAFPDGIVWITAGKEGGTDLVSRMREVGAELGGDLAGYDTPEHSKKRYRSLLRDKAVLIVVDDVLRASDVEPFQAVSRRSRLLFTTRDSSIANDVQADLVTAGVLTEEQLRLLLAKSAHVASQALPAEAQGIVREAAGLPLALAMLGGMLRDKPLKFWAHVLQRCVARNWRESCSG